MIAPLRPALLQAKLPALDPSDGATGQNTQIPWYKRFYTEAVHAGSAKNYFSSK